MSWVLNDPPPNFVTELEKCQRYQFPINGAYIAQVTSNGDLSFSVGNHNIRGTPTIKNPVLIWHRSGGIYYPVNTPVNVISVFNAPNSLDIIISASSLSLPGGSVLQIYVEGLADSNL